MKSIEIDKELEELRLNRHCSWAKLVSKLKKQLDLHIEDLLVEKGYKNFKLGYMPFLMNIDSEGITNSDLAKRFSVTKQASSKILNELIELNYITAAPHGADGRSSIVFLTDKGKRFVVEAKRCMDLLAQEYSVLLGKKNFENLRDMMAKVIEYNAKKRGVVSYM
ncbi:MAG: MarR family transcriptional regulator [Bacteroidota bacterium]